MTQPPLFDPGVKLTDRQQFVYDYIAGEGADALHVGHVLHERRGCRFCRPDEPCSFAHQDGRNVLNALRKKGLVIRRRSGLWQRIGETRAASDTRPVDDFPEGY